MSAESGADGPIHILDEIVVRPGLADAYRDAYVARYVPLAKARGMTLVALLRTPVADIAGEPATLFVHWTVPDARAWWGMRVRDIDAKADWWAGAAAMTISRRRLFLADHANVARA